MINDNDVFVLNPAYYLKNDRNKVIFCNRENIKDLNIQYDTFFTYLHPLNAQLLSFFNGKDSIKDVTTKASQHFKLSKHEIYNIISELIENSEEKSIRYKWHWMHFPKNTLVKANKVNKYYNYDIKSFLTYDNIDLGAFRLSAPISANLLLTMKCYTDCIYCYANRKISNKLMNFEQVKSIINQAKELNMINLDVNGGEVLLHPDSINIFSEMIKCGFYPIISTKIPIDKTTILKLKEIGVNSIQLSLDSVNNKTLTKILRVNDYYQKIDKTLHYLNEEGIKTTIHTVICSQNSFVKELSELINYLSTFSCITDIRVSPAGYSLYKEDNSKFKPNIKELSDIFQFVNSYNRQNINNKKIILDEYYTKEYYQNNSIFNTRSICTANVRNFTILPDGKVTICEELYDNPQFLIGDLTKQTIMEVWNSPKAKELFYLQREQISKESVCNSCSEFKICREARGVCWKEILMAYGKDNWDYPDPRCPKSPDMFHKIYTV